MHADGLIGDLKTMHAPLHSLEDGTMAMLLVLYPHRRPIDSIESLQAAMASPGGRATVSPAVEISTGGLPVVLIAEDDKPV